MLNAARKLTKKKNLNIFFPFYYDFYFRFFKIVLLIFRGPMLFLIYINDMFSLPLNGSVISYDTVIIVDGITWTDSQM